MNWKPLANKIIGDLTLRNTILNDGFAVPGNIGQENIRQLTTFYNSLHSFDSEKGGMFYSLYSDDIEYRKKVHQGIFEILKPVYDSFFKDYKTVINSFIVKTSGPGSDFSLHQDSTGLDEFQFSPLSLWIPLQDTDLNNGTLCIVPKTHGLFYPYRGISLASPFAAYEDVVRKYLVPVNLKAGDILFFDNRLVHYSHTNYSGKERIVVMSGVFPKEADILSVYQDTTDEQKPLEIFKQSEDFLVTNTAFYKDCTARPYRGEVIKKIYDELPPVTVLDFVDWATENNIQATDIPALINPLNTMQIISEPA
jgi:hypothetical protein